MSDKSRIDRYQLQQKLGEGATGIVYRAYDPVMDRSVAIKSIKTDQLSEDQIRGVIRVFHHEAKIAGKYSHENIVSIYDVIKEGGLDHIVMEFVPGRSVMDYLIALGPMGIDETLAVVYQCCVGLAYIHFHGVIHRDIKPGNILYHPANGIAKLTDFSVAQNIEKATKKTTGTTAYMAPEHFDPDRKITLLTDVFAMGSTMYRMLVQEYPFSRGNAKEQILNMPPKPIREYRPEVPEEVVEIVGKAMAKEDADRFQSAAKFAIAVKKLFNQLYPDSTLLNSPREYMTK